MIRFIYADRLAEQPILEKTMFQDRAAQFKQRLNWDVTVNEAGFERDEYDDMNPLYVIWQKPDGTHGGSMRFLPTVGRTMVNDHFSHLTDGVKIASPLIWECTRFCLAPDLENMPDAASALMLAGCEMGLRFGLSDSVGVFDRRMKRIYRGISWEPTVIGSAGLGREQISVGLWEFSEAAKARVAKRAGITSSQIESWFDISLPATLSEAA